MKGIVIAGVHSGCGKTTITLGLMAALRRRGLNVAPFKVGPDFIDPGHHTAITGVQSRNLDGWMLPRECSLDIFQRNAASADIAVVEGVMGLFDGYDGKTEAGSTAQMAKWLGLPVLLVVDARSMARSAAAVVQGFENFDPDLQFAGVLFNKVGSPTHLRYLEEALEGKVAMPCLGGIIRNEQVSIPSRHLGLVTSEDHGLGSDIQNALVDLVENNLNLDELLASLPEIAVDPPPPLQAEAPKVRIAAARDQAFCFYYSENLELLESCGAEIVEFSPLKDAGLPKDVDGLYLGGGYPELHAEALSKNTALKDEIFQACQEGMPIYGECGGFMVLCKTLEDLEGREHAMIGCFDLTCRMSSRLRALGYREITLNQKTVLGEAGLCARGHEFHYSQLDEHGRMSVYDAVDRSGGARSVDGFQVNRCLGSYLHLHFMSQPQAPQAFVQACMDYQKERKNR
ncbi:cobyrinate a,c-diamide synthase [Desulfatibacillum aliphaticivorans]|uniref:cobyrinate a,c-diamide synthase n=1 Tax=Desulfatibacillum aliphaticivorans TaxID=218208 RepID=UPI0003FB0F05|nr:cobyrinate a,c-diamide synthase [Desulfatibacillum aliphaticivorans]